MYYKKVRGVTDIKSTLIDKLSSIMRVKIVFNIWKDKKFGLHSNSFAQHCCGIVAPTYKVYGVILFSVLIGIGIDYNPYRYVNSLQRILWELSLQK